MAPKIEFVSNENTDRDFPDAFEITSAEFKVNGEYICAEPCGSGSAEHSLGDVHIYVDINGSDRYEDDHKLPIRNGSKDDPFATIERAFDYVNVIVTIEGDIYIHLGAGTFYISDTIRVNHPNKIIIVGDNIITSSLYFSDSTTYEKWLMWYGDVAVFSNDSGKNIDNKDIQIVNIKIGNTANFFANLSSHRTTASSCSDGTESITFGGWEDSYIPLSTSDYFIISIQADAYYFGDLTVPVWGNSASSDGIKCINCAGYVSSGIWSDVIEETYIDSKTDTVYFGDLIELNKHPSSCSDGVVDVIIGGIPSTMQYITFNTKTNATFFGNIFSDATYKYSCGASNRTIGLFSMTDIGNYINPIDKIVMTILSNSTYFGDVGGGVSWRGACSDSTKVLFAGGNIGTAFYNGIFEVNINIESNATHFGDLANSTTYLTGCSGN